jgi:transcriptional regulator with XRE-family HTH domain
MIRGGLILKSARIARGMTQDDVSAAHGVSTKTINRWESLVTQVSFDDAIWIITDIFKMTLTEAVELAINENNQRRSV